MELHACFGFLKILRESNKMFFQNVKIMASITILILLLNPFLLISNILYILVITRGFFVHFDETVRDFATKEMFLQITTIPGTSEFYKLIIALEEEVRIFNWVEWIFIILAVYVTSLFSAATTISASAAIYRGKDMSIKDLLLEVVKSWKGPSITWLYITLIHSFCLIFIWLFWLCYAWGFLFVFMLMFAGEFFLLSWIIINIPATVFLSYLAFVWTLTFVVSVMEERSGSDALEKARKLMNGLDQMSGFFLNLVFGVLSSVVCQGFRLIHRNQSAVVRLLIVLLVSNSLCLLNVFELMAFTVFYHECKKNKGEDTEIHGSLEYTRIPATPPISADMP